MRCQVRYVTKSNFSGTLGRGKGGATKEKYRKGGNRRRAALEGFPQCCCPVAEVRSGHNLWLHTNSVNSNSHIRIDDGKRMADENFETFRSINATHCDKQDCRPKASTSVSRALPMRISQFERDCAADLKRVIEQTFPR